MRTNKKNPWFICGEFNRKTTRGRCLKHCFRTDKELCIAKNIEEDKKIQKVRALEKEHCSVCGSFLISHLYFAFCPNCGLQDENGE